MMVKFSKRFEIPTINDKKGTIGKPLGPMINDDSSNGTPHRHCHPWYYYYKTEPLNGDEAEITNLS